MKRGFSLMDVLLGMVLLSGLFFAVATLFPISLSAVRKSQRTVVAANLARQTLETWRGATFQTLVQTTTAVGTVTPPIDEAQYAIVVTVSDIEPPDPNVKQIDVQVTSVDTNPGETGRAENTTCVYNYADAW